MPTEIESRYVIPDRILFDRLRRAQGFGPLTLRARDTVKVQDVYLDTPGRALMHQGWTCRLRAESGEFIVTLKGAREVRGSVVLRPEYEVVLPGRTTDATRWPKGPVRDRVLELGGGLPLRRLVSIRQTRYRFDVTDGLRPVALLCLDVVTTLGRDLSHRSLLLECELVEGGEIADLERLDEVLVSTYGLAPEARSKLRRALDMVEGGGLPDEGLAQRVRPATAEQVLERYGADSEQAQRWAALAQHLAGGLGPTLGLDVTDAALLRAAAMLHHLGNPCRGVPRHIVTRDLLSHIPIEGLDEEGQRILGIAAFLSRKPVTPERVAEVMPEDWPKATQRRALVIAALVRLAGALNVAPEGETRLHQLKVDDRVARVLLAGPSAVADAQRAQRRSDLWAMLSAVRLEWGALDEAGGTVYAQEVRKSLGINPWDSMEEAARKGLTFHLQRMLDKEAGTRLGEDPEELHDMRVATRRMRSMLRLFGPFLHGPLVTDATERLRTLGRLLGEVRDLDVAIERAQAHVAALPPEERYDLDLLLADWRRQRDRARRRMLRHLDGPAYQRLINTFRQMLDSLGTSASWMPRDRAVANVAPRFLYTAWRTVRGYAPVLGDAPIELLHALRIDCKRLRYGLEFTQDVLPTRIVALIPEVTALQDYLGEMHDAAVAVRMIDAFLGGRRRGPRYAGVCAYRDANCREAAERLMDFRTVWERFDGPEAERQFERLRKV